MKETRLNLEKLLNSGIHLDEDSHIYFAHSDRIFDLSVTELIDKQFKPFNKELVSKWLANNTTKYAHLTPEQIQQQWDEQRDKASRIHREIERYIKSGTKPILKYAKNGIEWYDREKAVFGNEYFSEVVVYSDEHEIAGTIDLLIYNEEKDGCYLFDWKTAKRIDSRGRNYGITRATRKIKDSKFNLYELQLSFYRYLLHQINKIEVLGQHILHINDDGVDAISCDYRKSTVGEILCSIEIRNSQQNAIAYSGNKEEKDMWLVGFDDYLNCLSPQHQDQRYLDGYNFAEEING